MGPGLGPEGQTHLRRLAQAGIMTVGAADGKQDPAVAAIAPAREAIGKGAGGQVFAALVAGNQEVAVAPRQNRLRLGRPIGLATLHLDKLDGPKAEGAPRAGGAGDPVEGQLRLRRRAKAADADEVDAKAQERT
jgi:hypothetical protein